MCELMNTAHAKDRLRSQWRELPSDYYYLFDKVEENGKITNLLITYGYLQVMRYLFLLFHAQIAIVPKEFYGLKTKEEEDIAAFLLKEIKFSTEKALKQACPRLRGKRIWRQVTTPCTSGRHGDVNYQIVMLIYKYKDKDTDELKEFSPVRERFEYSMKKLLGVKYKLNFHPMDYDDDGKAIKDKLQLLQETTNCSNSKYMFFTFGHGSEKWLNINHTDRKSTDTWWGRKLLLYCINECFVNATYQPIVILGECYGYGLLEAGTWRNIVIKAVATKRGQCTLKYKKYPVSVMQFILESMEELFECV